MVEQVWSSVRQRHEKTANLSYAKVPSMGPAHADAQVHFNFERHLTARHT